VGNCLLLLLYLGCTTNQRSIPFGYLLQLLVQGHQGLICVFWSSSISTRDAEGPGNCGSGVFVAEEVEVAGDKGSGSTTCRDTLEGVFGELSRLRLFSSTAEVSGFLKCQHLDLRHSTVYCVLCWIYFSR
jgi:hypothetical protein